MSALAVSVSVLLLRCMVGISLRRLKAPALTHAGVFFCVA